MIKIYSNTIFMVLVVIKVKKNKIFNVLASH